MSDLTKILCKLLMLNALVLLFGCASVNDQVAIDDRSVEVPVGPKKIKPNGAIFQGWDSFSPLFEDRRPHRVGDLITIILNEQVSASKNSSSTASRNGSASLTPEILPKGLESLVDYAFEVDGGSDFSGGGSSSANNTLTGTITVTVAQILANGNFRVSGEKQVGINQGKEFIRFSGIVDPRSVTGQNTVLSTEVANARIDYVGSGYISDSQKMGWLQRFFLTVSPF